MGFEEEGKKQAGTTNKKGNVNFIIIYLKKINTHGFYVFCYSFFFKIGLQLCELRHLLIDVVVNVSPVLNYVDIRWTPK